jgi:RNA polymerase sigma-70 factor, Bacteroides expansion family 1
MKEKELISQLRRGDKDAFSQLYHQYWAKVYNFGRLYITSENEIEEVVQEVFVKVWEARETVREDGNFKGFLFIVTRNTIFTNSRKHFNEEYYKLSVLNAIDEASNELEEEIDAKDLLEYLSSLLAELPPRRQEIFHLSRKEHLTYKEIAAKLNISEKTVERHINEALKYLRKNIKLYFIFFTLI